MLSGFERLIKLCGEEGETEDEGGESGTSFPTLELQQLMRNLNADSVALAALAIEVRGDIGDVPPYLQKIQVRTPRHRFAGHSSAVTGNGCPFPCEDVQGDSF